MVVLCSIFFAACSAEQEAAKLIHGVLTTEPWVVGESNKLSDSLNCGTSITGGTVSASNGSSGGVGLVQYDWEFSVQLPVPTNLTNVVEENYQLNCSVTLLSSYSEESSDSVSFSAPISIATCDDFDCTFRGKALNCEVLGEQLSQVCQ